MSHTTSARQTRPTVLSRWPVSAGSPRPSSGRSTTAPPARIGIPSFTPIAPAPLASLYSRLHEFEADAYAARHADAGDLVRALVKLYEDNAATLTPDPLHSAFYDSHPPAMLRIARLQTQQT